MQQWHFSRALFSLIAILVMAASLTVLGCGDDDDDDEEFVDISALSEVAGRTFTFPGTYFNTALTNQTVTVAFANSVNAAGQLPYTMSSGNTQVQGVATIRNPLFLDNATALVIGQVSIGDTTHDVDRNEDDPQNYRWINQDNNNATVEFNLTGTGGVGTTT
jgi:hypothetical protein